MDSAETETDEGCDSADPALNSDLEDVWSRACLSSRAAVPGQIAAISAIRIEYELLVHRRRRKSFMPMHIRHETVSLRAAVK